MTGDLPNLESRPSPNRRKRWTFRLVAVLLGLSLFGVFEGVCRVAGWGRPTDHPDPYVGFSEIHPLFVQDEAGENFVVPKSRLGFFRPESFPVRKPPGTFRIFCIGGSTVQGRPYAHETAFSTWLELSLAAGDPERNWEVVNCGGVSYASYRLKPIVEECRRYEPDLFIICTGHNEFLEERTYGRIKHAPKFVSGPMRRLSRLRTVTLLRAGVDRVAGRADAVPSDRPELKSEVDALLEYRNGLKPYHRDAAFRRRVIEHFRFNLQRMIDLAEADGVPVILILPPSNLRDQPPFKSQHSDGISADQLAEWRSLTADARSLIRSDEARAADLLERAAALNPQHAGAQYALGQTSDACWERTLRSERLEQARAAYWKALDEDVCPLRIIPPLRDALRDAARTTGTPLLDAHALLEAECPGGILDDALLVDHVHPSPLAGHQKIAHALAELMQETGWFEPTGDWPANRDAAYRRHLDSLDSEYFPKGLQRLKGLRAFTTGAADGPDVDTRDR